MAGPTKAEQIETLKNLGVDVDGKDHTQAELQDMIDARYEELAAQVDLLPGDAVRYCLTDEDARALTAREARFARFVKGVAPFEPRTYTEGDSMYGRVFSSFEDGTADIDLLGSFPRLTLKGVREGDEIGEFRKQG